MVHRPERTSYFRSDESKMSIRYKRSGECGEERARAIKIADTSLIELSVSSTIKEVLRKAQSKKHRAQNHLQSERVEGIW